MLPTNQLVNLRRRVNRARNNGPVCTSAASRHLQEIAEALATGKPYPGLTEDPKHCAATMLAVLENLWKPRARSTELRFAGWFVETPSAMSYRLWDQGGQERDPDVNEVALYEVAS